MRRVGTSRNKNLLIQPNPRDGTQPCVRSWRLLGPCSPSDLRSMTAPPSARPVSPSSPPRVNTWDARGLASWLAAVCLWNQLMAKSEHVDLAASGASSIGPEVVGDVGTSRTRRTRALRFFWDVRRVGNVAAGHLQCVVSVF